MKKKAAPKRAWKTGPEKEKTQVTVRLDKKLMDVVYGIMQRTNQRITDMIERGLLLAMEEEYRVPLLTAQVRFLVNNASRPQQEALRRFMTFQRVDEVREPSPADKLIGPFIGDYLQTMDPYLQQVAELYSRYGRTEAEVEKMRPDVEKMTG